jgi:hypothetical protein
MNEHNGLFEEHNSIAYNLQLLENNTQNMYIQTKNNEFQNNQSIFQDFNETQFVYENLIKEILNLVINFDYDKYKLVIHEILKKFPSASNKLQTSMENINENSSNLNSNRANTGNSFLFLPQFSQRNFYVSQILNILFSYENLFFSNEFKSLEVSVHLVLSFLDGNVIEGKYVQISYLYKLIEVCLNKYLDIIYFNKMEKFFQSLKTDENQIHPNVISNLITKLEISEKIEILKNKNIDNSLSKFLDNPHEPIIEENLNSQSFVSETFKDELPLEDFKQKVNLNLYNDNILHIYTSLKKESQEIEKMFEDKLESQNLIFPQISNFNNQHLYFFYKILKSLDESQDANLRKIFYNIIFRSRNFTHYLLKEVHINNNYLNFINSEVYLHQYFSIGHFFTRNILNSESDGKKIEIMNKLIDKVISSIKSLIIKVLQNNKTNEGYEYLDYNFEESILSKELTSLMCSSGLSIFSNFNELILNLNLYNITTNNLKKLIDKINQTLVKVSQIEKLLLKGNTFYILLKTQLSSNINQAQYFNLIITINSPEVFRINNLYPFLKFDHINLYTFIYIKYWATQRRLMFTFHNAINKDLEENFIFDNSLLLIFVLYYLINCGKCPNYFDKKNIIKTPSKNFVRFYIHKNFDLIENNNFNRQNVNQIKEYELLEIFYLARSFKIFNYAVSGNDNNKFLYPSIYKVIDSSITSQIGKLFLNFFYFLLSLLNKQRDHKENSMVIDLGFKSSLAIKWDDGDNILIIDHLLKFKRERNLKFFELSSLPGQSHSLKKQEIISSENLNSLFQTSEDYDILDKWERNKIDMLEKEASRVLYYALQQEDEDFIKTFFNVKKY